MTKQAQTSAERDDIHQPGVHAELYERRPAAFRCPAQLAHFKSPSTVIGHGLELVDQRTGLHDR